MKILAGTLISWEYTIKNSIIFDLVKKIIMISVSVEGSIPGSCEFPFMGSVQAIAGQPLTWFLFWKDDPS